MKFIRSVIAQDESISASDVKTYDLPVNPLSHIVLVHKALNVTDEATIAELLARITKVEVLYQGSAVFSMSGADLFIFNAVYFGKMPIVANQIATDNATRYIGMIVPMGRKLYDKEECFPAVNKGELQLQITYSATETACDGVILQAEAIEIPGASPKNHLKVTTLGKTPSATGDLDVDLPIANKILGLMIYGTTVIATTAWTNTVETIKMLVDSSEYNIAKANFEGMHAELINKVGHQQAYDASADADDLANYILADFDPNKDGEYAIDTLGKASVKLRVNAGDTNALRVLPIELVKV